jgi:hypothetical protein
LDCWCVALWQFTSVGISSIVILVYYFFAFKDEKQGDNQIKPSTMIYLFNMLTFPLNALSWNIAGIRNAKQVIS